MTTVTAVPTASLILAIGGSGLLAGFVGTFLKADDERAKKLSILDLTTCRPMNCRQVL